MKVKCRIGLLDGTKDWLEELDANSLATAEKDIKEIVKNFNNTLRPGEKPRKFISLVKKRTMKKKKKLEIWYIEPDNFDNEWLGEYLSEKELKAVKFVHYRELKHIEGTPDIIFIDTSAISPVTWGAGCSISLTYSLINFLKQHRSSLVYICSYVRYYAEEYLEEIKEHMLQDDLFVKICDNGADTICEEIKKYLK